MPVLKSTIHFALLLTILTATGCSMLLSERRFIQEMDHDTDGFFVAGKDFHVTSGDDGFSGRSLSQIYERTPASSRDKQQFQHDVGLEKELYDLEKNEKGMTGALYEQYGNFINTTSEKIYFLKLKSYEEREQYLYSLGLIKNTYIAHPQEIKTAVNSREIILGMSKSDVMSAWGRPSRVDVAGNPRQENERWSFYKNGQLKQVYFESGRVEGWDIE
jgi:hypothetical protein